MQHTDGATGPALTWSSAWRAALVVSTVVAGLAATLYHFVGFDRPVLVLIAGIVGLGVGVRLPAIDRRPRVHA